MNSIIKAHLIFILSFLTCLGQGQANEVTNNKDIAFVPWGFSFLIAEGEHLAFPSVTKRSNGDLFLSYRRGHAHSGPKGALIQQLGSSDGRSWTRPTVLYDHPDIDDREPSVTKLSDGRLFLNFFKYTNAESHKRPAIYQVYTSMSNDNGLHFSTPRKLSPGSLRPRGVRLIDDFWTYLMDGVVSRLQVEAASSPVVETDYGLMLATYGGDAVVAGKRGRPPLSPPSQVFIYRSSDLGESWSRSLVHIPNTFGLWLSEPALHQLPGGALLMHMRATNVPGYPGPLLQSISHDGGQTWSEARELPFYGQAPDIYTLSNGTIISAFRWIDNDPDEDGEKSKDREQKISFVYSSDHAQTWSKPIHMFDCKGEDCAYPSIVELSDNKVLFVFYAFGSQIRGMIYHWELRE